MEAIHAYIRASECTHVHAQIRVRVSILCGWLSARCAGSKKRKRVNRNEGIGTGQKEISSSINFLLRSSMGGRGGRGGIKERCKKKRKELVWQVSQVFYVLCENELSICLYTVYRC